MKNIWDILIIVAIATMPNNIILSDDNSSSTKPTIGRINDFINISGHDKYYLNDLCSIIKFNALVDSQSKYLNLTDEQTANLYLSNEQINKLNDIFTNKIKEMSGKWTTCKYDEYITSNTKYMVMAIKVLTPEQRKIFYMSNLEKAILIDINDAFNGLITPEQDAKMHSALEEYAKTYVNKPEDITADESKMIKHKTSIASKFMNASDMDKYNKYLREVAPVRKYDRLFGYFSYTLTPAISEDILKQLDNIVSSYPNSWSASEAKRIMSIHADLVKAIRDSIIRKSMQK